MTQKKKSSSVPKASRPSTRSSAAILQTPPQLPTPKETAKTRKNSTKLPKPTVLPVEEDEMDFLGAADDDDVDFDDDDDDLRETGASRSAVSSDDELPRIQALLASPEFAKQVQKLARKSASQDPSRRPPSRHFSSGESSEEDSDAFGRRHGPTPKRTRSPSGAPMSLRKALGGAAGSGTDSLSDSDIFSGSDLATSESEDSDASLAPLSRPRHAVDRKHSLKAPKSHRSRDLAGDDKKHRHHRDSASQSSRPRRKRPRHSSESDSDSAPPKRSKHKELPESSFNAAVRNTVAAFTNGLPKNIIELVQRLPLLTKAQKIGGIPRMINVVEAAAATGDITESCRAALHQTLHDLKSISSRRAKGPTAIAMESVLQASSEGWSGVASMMASWWVGPAIPYQNVESEFKKFQLQLDQLGVEVIPFWPMVTFLSRVKFPKNLSFATVIERVFRARSARPQHPRGTARRYLALDDNPSHILQRLRSAFLDATVMLPQAQPQAPTGPQLTHRVAGLTVRDDGWTEADTAFHEGRDAYPGADFHVAALEARGNFQQGGSRAVFARGPPSTYDHQNHQQRNTTPDERRRGHRPRRGKTNARNQHSDTRPQPGPRGGRQNSQPPPDNPAS
jgi:hypothetical protein